MNCPYYQNLCQRPSVDDYASRHYCRGETPEQCKAHRDITTNLLKFLAVEENVDFLDDVVNAGVK